MNHPLPFDTVIQGGRVFLADRLARVDIGIREGVIGAIAPALTGAAATIIDATGQLVLPGVIDAHTHMGIPIKDTCSADDFDSGSAAAALGGVTTLIDFTVQAAGQTIRQALAERLEKAAVSHIDYAIHVNITDQPAANLGQIPALVRDGYASFKLFSTYREAGMMVDWSQFRQIMQAVQAAGGFVLLHAEENSLIEAETAVHLAAGHTAPIYHPRSRTAAAEAQAITHAATIAGELGATLYIVHLSSAAGLEAGLRARQQGVRIYLETCPQYLVLTEERYLDEDGHRYITTPPLRTQADQAALWQAVANGDIDTIATDHCPFTRAQKDSADGHFARTPNGLPGVQTLLPLLYTHGVATGRIRLAQLVTLLSRNPARIFGLAGKGEIRVGADADLLIWADGETAVPATTGRADWSPYAGMLMAGSVRETLVRGQRLVTGGEFCGQQVRGRVVAQRP